MTYHFYFTKQLVKKFIKLLKKKKKKVYVLTSEHWIWQGGQWYLECVGRETVKQNKTLISILPVSLLMFAGLHTRSLCCCSSTWNSQPCAICCANTFYVSIKYFFQMFFNHIDLVNIFRNEQDVHNLVS